MKNPLITIITSCLNNQATIQKCIDSVFFQNFKNKEHIIIDGGSTDNTLKIIEKNLNKIDFYISEPDKGIYEAWNKGIKYSRGEWIGFLGADDFLWDENVLENLSKIIHKSKYKTRIIYGKNMIVDLRQEPIYEVGKEWEKCKNKFSYHMNIPHVMLLHRKDIFEDVGLFDEKFKISGDYDLLLREFKKNDEFEFINIILAGMRLGGISNKKAILAFIETIRAQRKNNIFIPWNILFLKLIRSIIRIFFINIFGYKIAYKIRAKEELIKTYLD